MSGDPIIEANVLLEIAGVRLIDARGQRAFDASHVVGAVRVPVELWEPKARSGAAAFADVVYWEREITALGIESVVPVVVYDDGRMIDASRVWFILQYFGVKARILNGGWPAIEEVADRAKVAPLREVSDFRAAPGSGSVGLIDRESLKARLNTDVGILDVRTTAEYDGEDLRQNARGGHLPGSSLLPHAKLLSAGHFRGADELLKLLADAGLDSGERLVTLCDAGGRAALAAAAAVRAGYSDIHIYYPSFSDWARDESCPVVQSAPVDVGEVTA
jgi:thiosulfate/3-mercaptopyruvate sulfurtransferase